MMDIGEDYYCIVIIILTMGSQTWKGKSGALPLVSLIGLFDAIRNVSPPEGDTFLYIVGFAPPV
jgi:hypothetical protein